MLTLAKMQQTKIYQGKHLELAQTCKSLGLLDLKQRDFPAAEQNLKESLELYQNLAGKDHPDTGRALVDLATLEKLQRRPDEAIKHLERAIEIFTAALGEKSSDTIDAVHLLASTLPDVGEHARAQRLYRQVLQNYLDAYGENDQRTGLVLFQLGTLYAGWSDIGNAESCLQRALAIFRKTAGESHAETAGILEHAGHGQRAAPADSSRPKRSARPPWRSARKPWGRHIPKPLPHRWRWGTSICWRKSSTTPRNC